MSNVTGYFPDYEMLRAFRGRKTCDAPGCVKPPIEGRKQCPLHAKPGRIGSGRKKELEPGKAHIYAIRSGEYIKFGQTQDMDRRLKGLQASNPHEVTLLGSILTGAYVEGLVLRHLASDCHRFEWFKATDRVMRFVDLIVSKSERDLLDALAVERAEHIAKRV